MIKRKYNKLYDSYYDEISNEWLESKCDDKECGYCKDRPNKPLKRK